MVNLLDDHSDFLSLLLKTEKNQRKALLSTLSQPQVDLLSEVFYNLINNFPIPQSDKKSLSKKKFVKVIADLKKSYKLRNSTVKKHKKQVEQILIKYRNNLLTLIK